MSNTEFALFVVTYPACNEGDPCRSVIGFGSFEDIFQFAEEHDPAIEGAVYTAPNDLAPPAWDYCRAS